MPTETTSEADAASALVMTFAHDLRQPLRSILMAAQRLQRSPDTLSDEVKGKLEEIVSAARRQEELIAGVVEYDQALQTGLSRDTNLALRLVIQTACMKVDAFRRLRDGAIRYEPDSIPAVFAPSGLSRVLEKILHNSLKFHSPGASPKVEVEVTEQAYSVITVRVCDDGIGVEPQYREAVFHPFKRLNPVSEYPGSGMSLATCRRLMESIRGTIRFEDHQSGPGAAVILSFPLLKTEN